jgi:hypothetical protein
MHLCADTLHAFTAFAGEVNSVFKPPVDKYVHSCWSVKMFGFMLRQFCSEAEGTTDYYF